MFQVNAVETFIFVTRYEPTMRTQQHYAISIRTAAFLLLLSIFLVLPMTARGHNLDQRFTYINLDPDTLDMMRTRVAAQQPPVQIGDTIAVVLKSTPGPGTLTGVGGYLTFYLPSDGTFQVVGAEYLAPDPNRPGYYMSIPIDCAPPFRLIASPYSD